MSPTSYQTAPPRALIITTLLFAVKLAPGRGVVNEIFAFTKHTVGSSPAPHLYKAARECGSHQGPRLRTLSP
jgi:hypothetical protein